MAFEYYNKQMRIQALNCTQKLTVVDGGLTVTAGGATVTAGGLTVTAGGVDVTAGGVTVTAGGLAVADGQIALRDTNGIIIYQGAEATSADDTSAVTAANVLTGIVKCTPGAARSKATDTASNFISSLALTTDGDAFDFSFLNLATTGGYDVTLTAGTGVTIVGNPIIAARDDTDNAISVGVGTFRLRRTSSTAVTLYRIG